MGFSKDLKQCQTLVDCQQVFDAELKRLKSLTLYQSNPAKLDERVQSLLVDIDTHMREHQIDGLIVLPSDEKLTTGETVIKKTILNKNLYKKVLLFSAPFIILLGVLVTFASVFQISKVNGHSMDPTLENGSYLLVNKYSKINRFDVVVAQELDDSQVPYSVVKRVVGLPDDIIEYKNDVLYVNGKKTKEPYLSKYQQAWKKNKLQDEYSYDKTAMQEALYSLAFTTQEEDVKTGETNADPRNFKVKVPKSSYFLLGDNRIVSRDSRKVGSFPTENIVGKVVLANIKVTKK